MISAALLLSFALFFISPHYHSLDSCYLVVCCDIYDSIMDTASALRLFDYLDRANSFLINIRNSAFSRVFLKDGTRNLRTRVNEEANRLRGINSNQFNRHAIDYELNGIICGCPPKFFDYGWLLSGNNRTAFSGYGKALSWPFYAYIGVSRKEQACPV